MSLSKMLANLTSNDNIGDAISDGVNVITQAVSSIFDFDGFPSDGEFSAVVLTSPVEIKFTEYEALGYTGGDIEADNSYYKFKVRIVNKRNNPHAVLEDPCDLSKTEEVCQQNGLIASHTTIATRGIPGVNIGSFVSIKLDKLPNDTFNLQTGHLLEVVAQNQTGAQVLNSDACESMSVMFAEGENFQPPQMIEVNSDIEYLAQKYDESPDIPYKSNHTTYFSAMNKMNSPFPKYFKALAYLAYERDLSGIFFTGKLAGVRTKGDQASLVKRYESGDTGVVAVSKTLGYHGAGLAADINVEIAFVADTGGVTFGPGIVTSHKSAAFKGTIFANKDVNKRLWEATNIVKYAKEIGLQWGGDFQSYYDPVHFQWTPPGWSRDDVKQAAAQAGATNGKIHYPTKTVQGDGDLGADTEVAAVATEQQVQAEEQYEDLQNTLYGMGDGLEDSDYIDVLDIVDPDMAANADANAATAAEERSQRSQHDHYKSASTETSDSSRFRGGAARDVDFDKFDVD
jgi:hypothetical protein